MMTDKTTDAEGPPPPVPHNDVEVIFWDMGDVLVSLDFPQLFGAICPLLDTDPKAFHHALFRSGIFDRVNRGATTPEEFHVEVIEALACDVPFGPFRDAWSQFFQPRPGMRSLLQQLRDQDQAAMWLLSNTDPMHHQACQQQFDILDLLTGQLTSYGLGAMKPEAAIYERALAHVGCAPERAMFFDDKPENIEGARALGIHAYLYTSEEECRQTLAAYGFSST